MCISSNSDSVRKPSRFRGDARTWKPAKTDSNLAQGSGDNWANAQTLLACDFTATKQDSPPSLTAFCFQSERYRLDLGCTAMDIDWTLYSLWKTKAERTVYSQKPKRKFLSEQCSPPFVSGTCPETASGQFYTHTHTHTMEQNWYAVLCYTSCDWVGRGVSCFPSLQGSYCTDHRWARVTDTTEGKAANEERAALPPHLGREKPALGHYRSQEPARKPRLKSSAPADQVLPFR